MNIAHPYVLLALIPAFFLCAWLYHRREPSLKMPSLTPFKAATGKIRSTLDFRRLFPVIFCFLSLASAIIALAGPRCGAETLKSSSRGITVQLVLDLSGSMESCDPQPGLSPAEYHILKNMGRLKTRLQIAKEQMCLFVNQRPDDEIGLIRFANCADMVCPPTLNHVDFLVPKIIALEIDKEYLGMMTGVNAALLMGVDSVVASKAKNGIVVLFTDGKDNIVSPVSTEEIAKHAADEGVRIYTVGIGSKDTGIETFDEALLQRIAKISGGKYYHSTDEKAMREALDDINKLERVEIKGRRTIYKRALYPEFSLLAVLCLALAMLTRCVVCPKLP